MLKYCNGCKRDLEIDSFYSYKKKFCKVCVIKKVKCKFRDNQFISTNFFEHIKQRHSTYDCSRTKGSTYSSTGSNDSTYTSTRSNDSATSNDSTYDSTYNSSRKNDSTYISSRSKDSTYKETDHKAIVLFNSVKNNHTFD